jgi:hypothetical protein
MHVGEMVFSVYLHVWKSSRTFKPGYTMPEQTLNSESFASIFLSENLNIKTHEL